MFSAKPYQPVLAEEGTVPTPTATTEPAASSTPLPTATVEPDTDKEPETTTSPLPEASTASEDEDEWSAQDDTLIPINETLFPDAVFREYVKTNIDKDKDGSLSAAEISNTTSIDVGNKSVTSLEGIKTFKQMQSLSCWGNQLTALDLTGLSALTSVNCMSNKLTSLDLSGRAALTDLNCSSNQLTSLNITGCTSLTQLDCKSNALAALTGLGTCSALKYLFCSSNQLTSLDLSSFPALTELDCFSNNLTTLDASGHAQLTEITCYSNSIHKLDAHDLPALTSLTCGGNPLYNLNLSGSTKIQKSNINLTNQDYSHTATMIFDVNSSDGSLDLSTVNGFDFSKTSNWTGATVDSSTQKIIPTVDQYTPVKFDFDTGVNDIKVQFSFYVKIHPAVISFGDTTSITLQAVGTTQKVSASVLPAAAFNKSYTITSADASVAVIDYNNAYYTVRATGKGTTKIIATAKDGGITAECPVTVLSQFSPAVSGKCGSNAAWNYDGNGKLTITGKGFLTTSTYAEWPWKSIAGEVTTLKIASGITGMDWYAFSDFYSLTDVSIPDTVKIMHQGVFSGCTSLETISLPDSVTDFWYGMFFGCTNLKHVKLSAGLTTVVYQTFKGCTSLEEIVIPEGIEEIEPGAFDECTSLKTVTLPSTLKTVGGFMACTSLESITLPENVTEIGEGAFSDCSSLKTINFPAGLTKIDNSAFRNCKQLTGTDLSGTSLVTIGDNAFDYCQSVTSMELPDTVTKIGADCFGMCTSLTQMVIPPLVTKIKRGAFADDKLLTSVVIPEGVKQIGGYAFDGCTSLQEVNLPQSVNDIQDFAFWNCKSLTSLVIPDGVENLYQGICDGCTSLTSVTIPASVISIYDDFSLGLPFDENTLKDVYYSGTEAQWNSLLSGYENKAVFSGATIHYGTQYLKQADAVVTFSPESVSYQRAPVKPDSIVVSYGGKALEEGKDFTVLYPSDITSVGRKTVQIKGTGSYAGLISGGYDIVDSDLSWNDGTVLKAATCTDTGITLYTCYYDSSRTKTVITPALGHDLVVSSVPCIRTAEGSFNVYRCSRCGKLFKDETGTVSDTAACLDIGEVEAEDLTETSHTIPDGIWASGIEEKTYTGSKLTQTFRVYNGTQLLKEKTDYTVVYKNNINAHQSAEGDTKNPTVTLVMKGNFSGRKDISFSINPADLAAADAADLLLNYTGRTLNIRPVVTYNGKTLVLNRDYTLSQSTVTGREGGTVMQYVTLTGKGNFTGSKKIAVTVTADVLMAKTAVSSISSQTYTGQEIKPQLNLTYKGKTLSEGKEYTAVYQDNTLPGTARVILTGVKGSGFRGTKTVTFRIKGSSIRSAAVSGLQNQEYKGESIKPTGLLLTVKNGTGNVTLTEGTDYSISYTNNTNAGMAKVIFTGLGAYYGTSLTKTFRILPAVLSADMISLPASAVYNQGGAKPEPAVQYNGKPLILNRDYTVRYAYNNAVTTAALKQPAVTVTGKGNFKGSVTLNFAVTAGGADVSKMTVTADDAVLSTAKNYWIKTIRVYDANGRLLNAGRDYQKALIYTLEDGTPITGAPATGTIIKVSTTGIGNYAGAVFSTEYRVVTRLISGVRINPYKTEYTGQEIKPEDFVVYDGKTVLVQGQDYEITGYSTNIRKGTAKVTLRGIGKTNAAGVCYGGTKTLSFTIYQRNVINWWKLLG